MQFRQSVLVSTVCSLLAACGGGGSATNSITAQTPVVSQVPNPVVAAVPTPAEVAPTTQPPQPALLTGVAATGAPLSGASIMLSDSDGIAVTKTAATDGTYAFDVSALKAPFAISATAPVGDTIVSLFALVLTKPAQGVTETANVTPLTHAMAALIAPGGNPSEFTDPIVLKSAVTQVSVNSALVKVKAAIENILVESGVNAATFNPVSTAFTTNRQGPDRVLELVRVELSGAGVQLTNAHALDDGNGSASVHLTVAASVAKLPASPVGTVLGELDHIATLATRCFADAPSVRITASDAAGIATALSAACTAFPTTSTYKSGGFTASERLTNLFKNNDLTGAVFSLPERVFTYPDGRVFYKMAYRTASGQGGMLTDVARKTNPAGKVYSWEIIGNQRDYDSTVDSRLDNTNQLNSNSSQEAAKSQYRVALRLFFNPAVTGGKNVQMVRVTGPGLPTAGVVMHRSSICGSNDYMTISNKTGALVNSNNVTQLWNNNTSNNFKLSAQLKVGTLDWSKVSSPSSWRSTPMSDADLAAIPPFAEYTFELWNFASNSPLTYRSGVTNTSVPDVTYKHRLTSRPPAVGSLKGLSWNAVNANGFLDPTNPLAAPQASASVTWTQTAEPVEYVSVFGQKAVANTTSTSATATNVRVSADTSGYGLSLNSRTSSVSPINETAGTTSLAGIVGANPIIPACQNIPFPQLDSVAGTNPLGADNLTHSNGSYREITIRSRASTLARKYVSNSWNNFVD